MAEEDRIRDIFGSESEDGDDHHLDEKPAAIPDTTQQDDFGDDDDEVDAQPARQRQLTPPESSSPSPGPSPARPMFVKVPLHDTLDPTELHLAKLSNILGLEPKPFDPSTFQLDEDHHDSQATIRWRWASNAQGNLKKESNARIVRWSDGSAQLFLGEDVLEVKEIDISDDNNYVFARHSNLMQGMGQLLQKTVFHPTGLASSFHQRLKGQVQKHNLPKSRVRATTTLVDPNKLNLEREQAEEQRIRDKERLLDRQQKAMRRYGTGTGGGGPGRGGPRGGLSTAFLEEADYEDEDEYGGNGGGRRGPMGEEEEAEAERRLREAKAAAVASLPRSGGALGNEDDDYDEEEMRDFIVDDEDEEEKKKGKKRTVGDEDDEESSGGEDGGEGKSEENGEEEEGKPAAKRQRGAVIIDSDSE